MCFPVVSFPHVDVVPTVGMTAILMSAAGLPVHLTCVPQAASTHKATKKHSSVKEGRKVSKKGSSCSNSGICFHLLLFISLHLFCPPPFLLSLPPPSWLFWFDRWCSSQQGEKQDVSPLACMVSDWL